MPLSAIAQALLEPVVEAAAQLFGHATGRRVLPVVTLGRWHAGPLHTKPARGRRGQTASERTARVASDEVVIGVGLAFWALAAVAGWWIWRSSH